MRVSLMKYVVFAAVATIMVSTSASAQYGGRGGGGGGRGGRGGRGGDSGGSSERADTALAMPPRPAPGVAALVLDHAADVAITDSQRVQLESIRREQDSANRPWLQRLDSLRPTGRPANGPNDLSQEQRDEIAARRAAIAEIMEGMRETNAVARKQTMELLSEDQQKKAAKLEQEAKQQADEARDRGQQGSGGEGRRRGGRQG